MNCGVKLRLTELHLPQWKAEKLVRNKHIIINKLYSRLSHRIYYSAIMIVENSFIITCMV